MKLIKMILSELLVITTIPEFLIKVFTENPNMSRYSCWVYDTVERLNDNG